MKIEVAAKSVREEVAVGRPLALPIELVEPEDVVILHQALLRVQTANIHREGSAQAEIDDTKSRVRRNR